MTNAITKNTLPLFNTLSRSVKGFAILCLLCSCACFADSPVWKVSKGENSLFVGGTMHMLSTKDYPLPAAFNHAYHQADVLIFETDLSQMNSSAFQQRLMQRLTYQDGTTLSDILQPQTISVIKAYLKKRQLDFTTFSHYKPALLGMIMSVMEIQAMGLNAKGVDEHFNQQAIADHKDRQHLESLDQQLTFMENLANGQEDRYLVYSLEEINTIHKEIASLRQAWRKGDHQKMVKEMLLPMKQDFPNIYRTLILQRNQAWVPQLQKALTTPETEFVLVGALHLVGEHGVLNQLRILGYDLSEVN